jgi:parallel beta-helix repeat protein
MLLLATLGSAGCGDDDSSAGGTGGSGGSGAQTGGKSAGGEGGSDGAVTLGTELHVVPGSKAVRADGSDANPFATLYDAIDAIASSAGWDGTILLEEGTHELDAEVIIPPNAYLTIAPGTTVASGPGVSIHAQRDVKASGTKAKPIVFTWLVEGSHWGSLTNFTPTSQNNLFEYVTFEHGYETNFDGIGMRGALSLNKAKALISHCTFQNNEGDDGLNIKASDTKIEYSLFKDNASDGLDSDGVGSPEVAFCTFDGNANDNLDLGEGTKMWVHDSLILNGGDKGISNGDGCTPLIEHNIIANGALGIGIKDDADPVIINNTIYGNQFGVRVYHHVDGFGGGKGTFVNNIVWKSTEEDLLYQQGSTVLAYSCIGKLLDVDGNDVVDNEGNRIIDQPGILTQDAGCDDPLFADPDNLDFHLQSEAGRLDPTTHEWVTDDATSPCIDAGDPDTDVGLEPKPNGSRVDMGMYGGTEEASNSP